MTESCVRITFSYNNLHNMTVSCVRITFSYNNLHHITKCPVSGLPVSCVRITFSYYNLYNITKCPVSELPSAIIISMTWQSVLCQDYLCLVSGLPSAIIISATWQSVLCQDYLSPVSGLPSAIIIPTTWQCPVSGLPVSCVRITFSYNNLHNMTNLYYWNPHVIVQLPSWQILRLWHRPAAAWQTTSQPESAVVVMLMYLVALLTGKHLFTYSWFLGHTQYRSPKVCLLLPARRRPVLFLPRVRCSLWLFLAAASSTVSFVFHGRC